MRRQDPPAAAQRLGVGRVLRSQSLSLSLSLFILIGYQKKTTKNGRTEVPSILSWPGHHVRREVQPRVCGRARGADRGRGSDESAQQRGRPTGKNQKTQTKKNDQTKSPPSNAGLCLDWRRRRLRSRRPPCVFVGPVDVVWIGLVAADPVWVRRLEIGRQMTLRGSFSSVDSRRKYQSHPQSFSSSFALSLSLSFSLILFVVDLLIRIQFRGQVQSKRRCWSWSGPFIDKG